MSFYLFFSVLHSQIIFDSDVQRFETLTVGAERGTMEKIITFCNVTGQVNAKGLNLKKYDLILEKISEA